MRRTLSRTGLAPGPAPRDDARPSARRALRAATVAMLPWLLVACPGELEDVTRFSATASSFCNDPSFDVVGEFRASCGGQNICHEGETPAANLDLVSDGVYERMVGRPSDSCDGRVVVDANDASQSFLIDKLFGPPDGCGDRMPLVGFLNDAEVGCVTLWLEEQQDAPGDPMDGGAAP
ncbi:MAG: hypothetical protein AAF447_15640 [Myxococcota bacterium]